MAFQKFVEKWETVNRLDPTSLTDARLNAHWAAQVIAGVGEALVAPEPDFSHTSMGWSDEFRALVGRSTARGSRVALRLYDFTMHIHAAGVPVASTELEGKMLKDVLGWVIAALEEAEGGRLLKTPEIPSYEMPAHDVGNGKPFGPPAPERLVELARWYRNAARLAQIVSENTLGASPVQCWPHHFDIATLISLDPAGSVSKTARSIGFGLSPGDGSYDQPYFYINPWPFPLEGQGYRELDGGGHWHCEGWFGAVLPASAIHGGAREQAEQVLSYARSAMAADRVILGTL